MARTHLDRKYALLEKLAELTQKMRHAQRQFFKTKDRAWMQESIEFEGKVDRICEELAVNRGYLRAESPRLFD